MVKIIYYKLFYNVCVFVCYCLMAYLVMVSRVILKNIQSMWLQVRVWTQRGRCGASWSDKNNIYVLVEGDEQLNTQEAARRCSARHYLERFSLIFEAFSRVFAMDAECLVNEIFSRQPFWQSICKDYNGVLLSHWNQRIRTF